MEALQLDGRVRSLSEEQQQALLGSMTEASLATGEELYVGVRPDYEPGSNKDPVLANDSESATPTSLPGLSRFRPADSLFLILEGTVELTPIVKKEAAEPKRRGSRLFNSTPAAPNTAVELSSISTRTTSPGEASTIGGPSHERRLFRSGSCDDNVYSAMKYDQKASPVQSNRFLRHMVRKIVAELIRVGKRTTIRYDLPWQKF